VTTRVLVVEDDESVALTLQAILMDDGHEVEAAGNAGEALHLIESTQFDLALLDLHLGEDDGLQILSRIKEVAPQTVALILTGYGSLDTAVKAMRIGAADYLLKPCDVTELKAAIARGLANQTGVRAQDEDAEDAASELQRVRDDFLELAGRELRTPLASVIGWAQYARRLLDNGATAEARNKLDIAIQEAWRIARLVEAFTEMVQVRQQGLELDIRPIDLCGVLELALRMMRSAYPKHRYFATLPDRPVVVAGDGTAIGTVFTCLLENSAQFSPTGSEVSVALTLTDNEAIVSVKDRGIGIPPSELTDVFSRYEQPRLATRRREPGGLGMGLYLSRAIITAHGGRIWAQSAGPGEGSTFSVALPLAGEE
jgi:signal transduction histidine kinase